MKTKVSQRFLRHEDQAKKKGPNGVKVFPTVYVDTCDPKTVKDLHLFDDTFPGQNENDTRFRLCMASMDTYF
jgi:hypothetical protein